MNTQYKFIFLRKLNDTYFQFKTIVKNNFQDKLIKLKDRSYVIDLESSFYESKDLFNRRILIYLIDFDSGLQFKRQNIQKVGDGFKFEGSGILEITPDLVDEIGEASIMKHFSNSMKEHSSKFPLAVSIFMILFGVMIGFIIGYFYFKSLLPETTYF